MERRTVRIVHCDDSPSFLKLMERWMEDHDDLEIVHSAHGIRDAIQHVHELQPDVIVTDTLGSPGDTSGLGWLRDAAPQARLVIFTGYVESQLHAGAREIADAVVTKGDDERDIVRVIRLLAQ